MFHIIIPTYNRQDTIERAINSVINQWFKDYYLYVIDDWSTDDTKNILSKYLERYKWQVFYKYKKNWWVCSARNLWIELAIDMSENIDEDWIIFFDSDDELIDNSLHIITDEIKKSIKHNCNIIFFPSVNEMWKKISHIYNNKITLNYWEFLSWKYIKWDFNWVTKLNLLLNKDFRFLEDINWWEAIFWYKLLWYNYIYLSNSYIQRVYYDWNNSLTRGILSENKIKNSILLNEYLIKYYWKDFYLYNKKQLWIFFYVLSRMQALLWYRILSFENFVIWLKYGLDIKRILLYFLSIFPYWININNFLIKLINNK